MGSTDAPTNSLSAEELARVDRIDASLVKLVRSITDTRTTEMLKRWAGVDIERRGFTLLARIEEFPDAHLAQVAAAADVDTSTASRQVARLVEHGLVERTPDPAEHRARRHRLTDDGAAALARLRDARRRWIDGIVSDFSVDEQAQLADLLTRFADKLHDTGRPAESVD